jgi:hypothetical protein
MASISKRNGKWRARYPHPNPHPNRPTQQIERKFNTKKEAENWLATQQHSILTASHIDPASGNTTYADLAQIWQTTWRTIEPKTAAGYTSILDTHLLPEFGSTKLNNLTPARIESFSPDSKPTISAPARSATSSRRSGRA